MNLSRNVDRDPADAAEHCKAFLKKVRLLVREHGDDFAAAAEAAAGVFLGIVSIMEVAAVSQDLRTWAKGIPERKKQSKHLQAWLQDPAHESKLFAAVAKGIKEDAKSDTRARRFGDLIADPQSDSSSSPPLASTPPDSESAALPAPHKHKKKSKGKKTKKSKNKQSKTKKKMMKKKTVNSSEETSEHKKKTGTKKKAKEEASKSESGSRSRKGSSADDSEPVSKKRKHSASASAPKTKMRAKQADVSSEGTETLTAAAVLPKGKLVDVWPLKELQKFEEAAAAQAALAAGAGLEVDQELVLVKGLPQEVQQIVWVQAGLLPTTQEDEVLKANAARLIQYTTDLVREVRLAWVAAAVAEDMKAKKYNVALMQAVRLFGRVKREELPEEQREAWENALKDDSERASQQLQDVLRTLWEPDTVLSNYDLALCLQKNIDKRSPRKRTSRNC